MNPAGLEAFDVLIVGAGPAGLGTALALAHMGVTDRMVVVDRHHPGAAFDRWPAEMQLITPSFNSNQFGWLDLNSFGLRLSPAQSIGKEHPTGPEFAGFLRAVASHLHLPVRSGVDVRGLAPDPAGGFRVSTSLGLVWARFVVWAAGEFLYPKADPFPGADLCVHNARVKSWLAVDGDEFAVVGGYESGIDAAVHLARRKKRVRVFDPAAPWDATDEDPSVSLSPFTRDRLAAALATGRVELVPNARVERVEAGPAGRFAVHTAAGTFTSPTPPVLATGFDSSLVLVEHLFDRAGGHPVLTADDESTTTPGLFLVGPRVRHGKAVFCFIYKFRQRLALVARAIADRLGHDTAGMVELYRERGMYLDDLSCCEEACHSC